MTCHKLSYVMAHVFFLLRTGDFHGIEGPRPVHLGQRDIVKAWHRVGLSFRIGQGAGS